MTLIFVSDFNAVPLVSRPAKTEVTVDESAPRDAAGEAFESFAAKSES